MLDIFLERNNFYRMARTIVMNSKFIFISFFWTFFNLFQLNWKRNPCRKRFFYIRERIQKLIDTKANPFWARQNISRTEMGDGKENNSFHNSVELLSGFSVLFGIVGLPAWSSRFHRLDASRHLDACHGYQALQRLRAAEWAAWQLLLEEERSWISLACSLDLKEYANRTRRIFATESRSGSLGRTRGALFPPRTLVQIRRLRFERRCRRYSFGTREAPTCARLPRMIALPNFRLLGYRKSVLLTYKNLRKNGDVRYVRFSGTASRRNAGAEVAVTLSDGWGCHAS